MTTKEQLIIELRSMSDMCLHEIGDVERGCTFVAIADLTRQLARIDSLNDKFWEEQDATQEVQ